MRRSLVRIALGARNAKPIRHRSSELGAAEAASSRAAKAAIFAALEIVVCNESADLYRRGFAFYKLLKLRAAGRHSVFEGLSPFSFFLFSVVLERHLGRTKTSGPGRRIRVLRIFVSRAAYLVKPDWALRKS